MSYLCRFVIVFFIVFINPAVASQYFKKADNQDCKIYIPKSSDSGSWLGSCEGGFAQGKGTLTYTNKGKETYTYRGLTKNGEPYSSGLFVSPSGLSYTGQFKFLPIQPSNKSRVQYHGKGALTYRNGDVCTGTFNMDKLIGSGKCELKNGIKYVGMFKDGKYNGKGTLTWPRGDKFKSYVGLFSNGKRHGYGTFTWSNGNKYIGIHKTDEITGLGKMIFSNGASYSGQFVSGDFQGKGKYKWPDGQVTVGLFNKNKASGYHTVSLTNGNTYKGTILDGRPHGSGELIMTNGWKYKGMFNNNVKEGKGVLTWPDGKTATGQFSNNQLNGYAVVLYPDGASFKGNHEAGIANGYGVLNRNKPDKTNIKEYKGNFLKGKFHGVGEVKYFDGSQIKGTWNLGKLLK